MYFPQLFVATLLAVSATLAGAASIGSRQSAISCNVARLQIVKAIGDTNKAVGDIQDPTVQTAAAAGVKQAQGGVADVAKSIFSGAAPSADGRNAVEAGLNATSAALAGGDATDPALATAQTSLQDAIAAGQDVLANFFRLEVLVKTQRPTYPTPSQSHANRYKPSLRKVNTIRTERDAVFKCTKDTKISSNTMMDIQGLIMAMAIPIDAKTGTIMVIVAIIVAFWTGAKLAWDFAWASGRVEGNVEASERRLEQLQQEHEKRDEERLKEETERIERDKARRRSLSWFVGGWAGEFAALIVRAIVESFMKGWNEAMERQRDQASKSLE
ncbi:hypothetical protein SCUP515_06689 [Seiridium cupressi]